MVRAVDNAGNIGPWSGYYVLNIFTPPPTTTPASVSGHVYTSSGSPISGATVTTSVIVSEPIGDSIMRITDPIEIMLFDTTGTDGSYQITGVTTGSILLQASASGYVSQTQTVIVTAGVPTFCDFSLTLVGAAPPPPPDDSCFVKGTKIAAPDGEVNIEDIAVGDYVLSFNEVTGKIESNEATEAFAPPRRSTC